MNNAVVVLFACVKVDLQTTSSASVHAGTNRYPWHTDNLNGGTRNMQVIMRIHTPLILC